MMARRLEKLASRLAEVKAICRTFATREPKRQPAKTPISPRRNYMEDGARSKTRHGGIALAETLSKSTLQASDRQALDKVSRWDRVKEGLVDVDKARRALDLERQIHRKWNAGDVYAPHDLSPIELQKWSKRRPRQHDAFDLLGINPLHEYKNFSMMSEYMTPTGRIKHRRETGLRAVNQRRIAKAIRRAVSMGLMPSVHKHPEVLEAEAKKRNGRLEDRDIFAM